MKSYLKMLLALPFCLLPALTSAHNYDNNGRDRDRNKTFIYPHVNYTDVVFTDQSRVRNGAIYTGGTPLNGFRLIDVRIYRPAKGPGTGAPLKASFEPIVYNGTFANYPLVPTDMKVQFDHTWTDNVKATGKFPLIVMFGGGGNSLNVLKLAEDVASAGFIVAVPSGYGVDASTCPIPGFCAAAVARTQARDARAVIDAAQNSLLGFPSSEIKKDNSGIPIAGCVGGSAGGVTCILAAGGVFSGGCKFPPW